MNAKITLRHTAKKACVYLRQSTPGQLRLNRESTERQYRFREKAVELGWPTSQIQILDRDLGVSGAHMADREDFKELVTEVSMDRVGGVFALEASRLSRSCADWHRLLELCALTGTLIIDEDGIYDPMEFNDQLLLGLKGTMSQAELHFLRARLQGGKRNKAQKGLLRFPLPVGFCYDDLGHIVVDPDEQVRSVIALFFSWFRDLNSAYGVVRRFAAERIDFPKRAYGGAWNGQLIWGRLEHGRALGLLRNPSYAGCYVFGRYRGMKRVTAEAQVTTRTLRLPMDQWQVMIPDHHAGYITWEQYQQNQTILERNRTNGEENVTCGPAREGHALLQGLLLCGGCGHRLTVRYKGNGGICPTYECNWHRRRGLAGNSCLVVRCHLVDQPVVERVLAAFAPAQLEIAVQALAELEKREAAIQRQWQLRRERAVYEAQLAQRRYDEVDPANRLVAATLEKRWNEALENRDRCQTEYEQYCRQEAVTMTAAQRQRILALAKDLPRIWHSPTTKNKDRKEIVRLIIKDITVNRQPDQRQTTLHLRWQGGACEDLTVEIPPPIWEKRRYPDDVIARVRQLAQDQPDERLAAALNEAGYRSATGHPFTSSMIKWIRYKHGISAAPLKRSEERTVQKTAAKFEVSANVV